MPRKVQNIWRTGAECGHHGGRHEFIAAQAAGKSPRRICSLKERDRFLWAVAFFFVVPVLLCAAQVFATHTGSG